MTENGLDGVIPSPTEAMLDETKHDTPDKRVARSMYAQEVRNVLIDPKKKRFTSRGSVTVTWTLDNGETWEEQVIPIKSLSAAKLDEISTRHQVDNSEVPRVYHEETGQYLMDQTSVEWIAYAQAFLLEAHEIQMEKLVWAYDGDLEAVDEDVLVWSKDDPSLCDVDRAMESWRAMDIPPATLAEITEAIDNLSRQNREQELDDFGGKSRAPSESRSKSTSATNRSRRRGQRNTR